MKTGRKNAFFTFIWKRV